MTAGTKKISFAPLYHFKAYEINHKIYYDSNLAIVWSYFYFLSILEDVMIFKQIF